MLKVKNAVKQRAALIGWKKFFAVPFDVRFWKRVSNIDKPNECWAWAGGKMRKGYGGVRKDKKNCSAHRVAFELAYGQVPAGLHVLHKCDNPACCNPKHLFLGTNIHNQQDAIRKGRRNTRKGKDHPNWGKRGEEMPSSVLTEASVREIRGKYSTGKYRQSDLASEYKIGTGTVSEIVTRKRWAWVK